MPMQAESLEVLEKASVAPVQARAIVRAIEIEIAGAKDTLATKHDLLALRQDLRGEMTELRSGLRGEMTQLRAELRREMTELRAELRSELSTLAAAFRVEMKELGAALPTEMAERIGGVTRQMYVALLGQVAVMLGYFYFFLSQLR
jgi:hypothetical protein